KGRAAGTALAPSPRRAAGTVLAPSPRRAAGTAPTGGGAVASRAARDGSGAGAAVRQRLALAQAALLSALVAGTPVPEGFDRVRLGVQARALAGKRADVVAKVAPELPVLLGAGYRSAFLAYAQKRPLTGGHRRDALDFVEHLMRNGRPQDAGVRIELREWWLERSGPVPRSERPGVRWARATRRVLLRR
ncbi:endonuclease, partial [Streptomyces sp. NPDC058812]